MKLLKNTKLNILFAILAVTTLGIFIYKRNFQLEANNKPSQEMLSVKAEKGLLKETVSASGQIETANYLAVTTSVNGIVKEVFIKEGQEVYKGQPIMEVTLSSEGEESRASAWGAYLLAKTSLESAKTQLISLESSLISAKESFQDEKEDNSYQTHDERIAYTLAENTVEVAQSNYDNQKDTISQREIALNKAWLEYQAQSPTIVAPDEGIIANIVVVEGMEISNSLSERTSATVASVRKEGTPIASLNVSEVDINKIKVGQNVELTLNSIEGETFIGSVVGIDKIGTISSGVSNYPVIVKFEEDSDLVLPNMGVDADIIVHEEQDVVYVPVAAVTNIKGKSIVTVKENKNIRQVEVEIGISTNEYTEIINGIDAGTTVLIGTLPTSGFTETSDSSSDDHPTPGVFPGMGGGRR